MIQSSDTRMVTFSCSVWSPMLMAVLLHTIAFVVIPLAQTYRPISVVPLDVRVYWLVLAYICSQPTTYLYHSTLLWIIDWCVCMFAAFACSQPSEVGQFPMAGGGTLTRWYNDPVTAECKSFNFRGSKGNANNFETKEHCESYCQQCKHHISI